MLSVAIREVKPERVEQLREWMRELERRQDEVRETFAQEGVRHEQAYLIEGSEGPLLIYVIEVADAEQAQSAFRGSQLAIDREHARIMGEVLGGDADAELLYECRANE